MNKRCSSTEFRTRLAVRKDGRAWYLPKLTIRAFVWFAEIDLDPAQVRGDLFEVIAEERSVRFTPLDELKKYYPNLK